MATGTCQTPLFFDSYSAAASRMGIIPNGSRLWRFGTRKGPGMGAFDQAARFAAQANPDAVVRRVLAPTGANLPFREWLDTRTIPFPGGPNRTADLVAALDDPVGQPALVVFEFQSRHDPEKLDVTLEEVGILRGHARHGDDRKGKYKVLTALVYLTGRCPEDVLDMTLPGGFGTRHAPLVWNVGADGAAATLEAVAGGQASWGMLFWVPLMIAGKDVAVIARWKEVVAQVVPDRRTRGNLAGIALVFAELLGRRVEWDRGLEGFEMTESQVVNEWISQGEARGKLAERRQNLLKLLAKRFPGAAPDDVVRLINEQESLDVLGHWFDAAAEAYTFQQFLDVLKR